jgi:hypothetical protein
MTEAILNIWNAIEALLKTESVGEEIKQRLLKAQEHTAAVHSRVEQIYKSRSGIYDAMIIIYSLFCKKIFEIAKVSKQEQQDAEGSGCAEGGA